MWTELFIDAKDLDDAIEGSRRVSDRAKKGPAPAYSPEGKIDKKRSRTNLAWEEGRRNAQKKLEDEANKLQHEANKLRKKLEVAEAANQRLMRRNFSLKEDFGSAQDARYQRSAVCKV